MEESIGYVETYSLGWASVEKKGSGGKSLGPVGRQHVSLEQEGAGNIVESADRTLGFAILWRGVGAG
jgi:hypothetical protein